MKGKFIVTLISALLLSIIGLNTAGTTAVAAVGEFEMQSYAAAAEDVSVSAKAAFLTDYDTGTVLYEKNADARLPIASMVKIMTSLLCFEAVDAGKLSYTEEIEISAESAGMGGSQIFLDAGSKHTVENLLKCVVVASANDASVALAERVGGSESGFVRLMNKKAADLGLKNTNFTNCTGLPAPDMYCSARDISTVLRQLLGHKRYYEFCSVWLEDYVHPDGRTTVMTNTNKLIRFYKGCDSGKTGFTSEALFCLAASAKRGDMRIISTVIGAPNSKSRFADVSNMFNYAFGAFENKILLDTQTPVENDVKVTRGKTDSVEIVPVRNVTVFMKRGEESSVEYRLELPDKIKAPLKAQQSVGKVVVIKNGEVVDEVELVVKTDVDKATLLDMIKRITQKW